MTRQRWLWLRGVVVLAALLGSLALLTRPEPKVTLNTFLQIRRGMTVEEIDRIFGFRGSDGPCGEGECGWWWSDDSNTVSVSVGQEDGRVRAAHLILADGTSRWLERKD